MMMVIITRYPAPEDRLIPRPLLSRILRHTAAAGRAATLQLQYLEVYYSYSYLKVQI